MGYLQHGFLFLGLRDISAKRLMPTTLTWTPSHPDRTKPQSEWTDNDCGIHLTDEIAGSSEDPLGTVWDTQLFLCNSEEVRAALTTLGTW